MWKCWLTIWQIITNLELRKYMQFLPFTAAFFFRYPVFPNTPTYSKYHFCIFCVILAYPISYQLIPMISIFRFPFLYLLWSLSVGPFMDVAARFYTFLPKTHPRSFPHWSSAMSSLLGLWKMWQKRTLTPVKSHGRATGMCRWFSFQPPKWWCIVMRNMYQKGSIEVDRVQKGQRELGRKLPKVFGTDQLGDTNCSVPSVSWNLSGGATSWHSCWAKSTEGCDVFTRFSHSFLEDIPTLRYNSPLVDLQRPVSGYSLDQRRYLAFQHVAWPLCRELAASEDSEMARSGGFSMMLLNVEKRKLNVLLVHNGPRCN